MRKWAIGILALAVAAGAPALADDHDSDFEFETEGQVRVRWDAFENYNDFDDDIDDSFNWFPFRANIGLTGSFNEQFWGFVELTATGFFGDGNSGAFGYPGPTGGNVDLYQGFVMWDNDNWDLRVGRGEHELGNELIMGNNSFYNGLVFDGLRLTGEWESLDLDLFAYQTTEGQLFPTISDDDDAFFLGAEVDVHLGPAHLRPYIVHLQDDSDGGVGDMDPRLSVSTLGILWKRPTVDNDGWDASVEVAGQFGDVGRDGGTGGQVDAGGTIFEGWFGWTFGSAGRFHIGALWASGDDDPLDGNQDAWVPLFEDGHAYNRLGNLDLFNPNGLGALAPNPGGMTNVQDINIGYTWGGEAADSKHTFFAAIHNFTIAEEGGLADDDIGNELDLTYSYEFVKNSTFQVGIGQLFAGDALGPNADDITRVWFQLEASWGKAKPWTAIGQSEGWSN